MFEVALVLLDDGEYGVVYIEDEQKVLLFSCPHREHAEQVLDDVMFTLLSFGAEQVGTVNYLN